MNPFIFCLSASCLAVLITAEPEPYYYGGRGGGGGGGGGGWGGQPNQYGGGYGMPAPAGGSPGYSYPRSGIRAPSNQGLGPYNSRPSAQPVNSKGLIGGLRGPAAQVINKKLGNSLGGVLTSLLLSGVGGTVSSNPDDGGCGAVNVVTVIEEFLDALQIDIEQCSSDADCGGSSCISIPGAPSLGKICKI